jgi:hypothetical protein
LALALRKWSRIVRSKIIGVVAAVAAAASAATTLAAVAATAAFICCHDPIRICL